MSAPNQPALTDTEAAIYCLWVVDYSIRNSGTLGAMEDLYPDALVELHRFARERRCDRLSLISDPENADDKEAFCEDYRTSSRMLVQKSALCMRGRYQPLPR